MQRGMLGSRQIVYHSDEQRERFGCRLLLVRPGTERRVTKDQLLDEVERCDERTEGCDERFTESWVFAQKKGD